MQSPRPRLTTARTSNLTRVSRVSLGALSLTLALTLASPAVAAPKMAELLGNVDIASATTAGALKGLVQTPGGTTVFLLEAKLLDHTPAGANGVAGAVDGVLRNPATGNVVAHVKGKYVGGPNGQGKLEAIVLKPSAGGAPPTVVGKMRAHWIDTNPVGTPGKFKGRAIFK